MTLDVFFTAFMNGVSYTEWLAEEQLTNPGANAAWSITFLAFASPATVYLDVIGRKDHDDALFQIRQAATVTDVSNTNKTGIAINLGDTLSLAEPLSVNTWANGNIVSEYGEQWFKFTATAATQYIHVTFGTVYSLNVQLYDSAGNTVGSMSNLSDMFGSNAYTSNAVTNGQVYYIKAWTNSSSDRGYTYQIAFNTSAAPPVPSGFATAIPLTVNTWANGNIALVGGEEWFKFTATASTQYIHFMPGTLDYLYVQLYDSAGNTVGSQSQLYGGANASNTVTAGQVYYIKVRPFMYTLDSGSYQIAFSTSSATPLPPVSASAAALAVNTWADSIIASEDGEQWFKFTATADTQYIHFMPGTLDYLYVQLYDSAGNAVGNHSRLDSYTKYASNTVTNGQVYYIKVSSGNSGNCQIAFNASLAPPLPSTSISAATLAVNTWADGNIPTSDGEQWFKFTATASTQYIHFSPGILEYLDVQLYDSAGNTVGSGSFLQSGATYASNTVTSGQAYYIKVWPSGGNSGSYQIAFNTSIAPPGSQTLIAGTWADGNIPTSDGEQWFKFTATGRGQLTRASR